MFLLWKDADDGRWFFALFCGTVGRGSILDELRQTSARQVEQKWQVHVNKSSELGTVGRPQLVHKIFAERRTHWRAGRTLRHREQRRQLRSVSVNALKQQQWQTHCLNTKLRTTELHQVHHRSIWQHKQQLPKEHTRSSAVAVIADHPAYDARSSYTDCCLEQPWSAWVLT